MKSRFGVLIQRFNAYFFYILMLGIVLGYTTGTASAQWGYNGSGHFGTGSLRWVHEGTYYNQNYWALSHWNSSTDLRVYYGSSPQVKTRAMNLGNPNLFGTTYICSWLGGMGSSCTVPTNLNHQYIYCEARSNTEALSSWSSDERTFNALHELGHCWSLAHRGEADSAMIQGQHSHTWPNSTDNNLVNARH